MVETMPVEEIEIHRTPPKYAAPEWFKHVDDPKRPALILDMNGVLCMTHHHDGRGYPSPPSIDAQDVIVKELDEYRFVRFQEKPCIVLILFKGFNADFYIGMQVSIHPKRS